MVNVFSTLRGSSRPILGDQPSIFEVHYPSSLSKSLYNALKFITKILVLTKFGNVYNFLYSNLNSLYLIFNILLNYYYLKFYGSSFFEYFYGIKRVVRKTGTIPSSNVEIGISLIQIALFPYIKNKLNEWKNKFSESLIVSQSKLKLSIIKVWPYIEKLIYFSSIILEIMYLFGFIPIHSIELLMTGIYYEKYSPIDLKLMENRKLSFETSTIVGRSMNLFVGLFSKFGKILSYILVAIQVLNFVQESADGVTSKIFNIFSENSLGERKSDIQFPVKKLNEAEALNLSENQCPLCLKKRENDTVLSCSGYIFCFKCIYQFISKYGRCPVTSIPATTKELVKMYV